jgi:uncharacterized membrane protein YcaP (DUF421 family)
MEYASIFDPIAWPAVISSAAQAVVIYWVTIICIKLIGIHIVGQTGPQYLAFLLLFTTGMSSGLSHQQAGFWGSLATALALTATIIIVARIPFLERWIHGSPMILMDKGKMDHEALKKTLVDKEELNKLAHGYGMLSHEVFESVILENDGRLTAILKPEYRQDQVRLVSQQ